MTQMTLHNPDRLMADLRQILAQGRKRIGLLIGAGAPVAVRVNEEGKLDRDGKPLIPDVERLTKAVVADLKHSDKAVVDSLLPDLGENPNIEVILTRIRRLSQSIGNAEIHGLNGAGYEELANSICQKIGGIVGPSLPIEPNPFTELVSWIGGTHRDHAIEVFTPNYDLLLEEAFERSRLPYFDGFTGSYRPFFDPASISDDVLPPRWSRLWKIHGSLGWEFSGNAIIRNGSREATMLIYPDHLKYDQITRQPFSALYERLRTFLMTPDSLLLCVGFSFGDAQISAVLDEALAANTHSAIFAFQFRNLDREYAATNLALRRPNLSVYARDGAVIFGVPGPWQLGRPLSEEWASIRSTFWKFGAANGQGEFLLGDFALLARFCALAQATELRPGDEAEQSKPEEQLATAAVAAAGNAGPLGSGADA